MSTEAYSFITVLLETLHKPQASIFQCLKEPSCAKIVKDPCPHGQKSRNCHPKKIRRNKQPKKATHSTRGIPNFKEERVEGIGWAST
jgi:hypothetical protein